MAKQTPIKGKKGREHVGKVMRDFYKGDLKSSSGKKVTDRKQALAISLHEARAGQKRGFTKRASATEKGRVRERPKLTRIGKKRAAHK